jgi:diguanylate cyclase (GGDEF)-like protein
MSLYRLRTDFQFAIIVLFGAVAVLGILPFAIYRFASGRLLAGSVDLAIVTCLVTSLVYAWRGGNLERVGLVLMVACTVGCVAIATLLGLPGLLWMYPVVVASFLVVRRQQAMIAAGLAIGFLVIDGRAFGSDLERVTFLITASVVGLFAWIFAHRSARQRAQLEFLAARDPLTGIGNRRAMEQELLLATEAHGRHLGVFGLALLDLDHFKRINDNYGHEAGDETLVAFTTLVQGSIRKLDRFYRIGGEEFVLLLPGVDATGLATIGEHVRVDVAAGLRCRNEPVTVSIGATMLRPDDDSASWLARADEALYRAKYGGRNRVEVVVEGNGVTQRSAGIGPGESSLRSR